jgi:cytochrome c-type protein NapB
MRGAFGAGVKYAQLALSLCCIGLTLTTAAQESASTPERSSPETRAKRRAFDGAPPVIPHQNFSMQCVQCHTLQGVSLPGVGFSPPTPHQKTPGLSADSRCQQCHVFKRSDTLFAKNSFVGLKQDLQPGKRLNSMAPPVIPHKVFMRENCVACHSGPAAREVIRTPHPERERCQQCHVSKKASSVFSRSRPTKVDTPSSAPE